MKQKVKEKVTSPTKTRPELDLHEQNTIGNWIQAAEDARVKIDFHKKKIRCLEQALQTFEHFAREGVKWPQR
jgi:hypothetical protein